jgi:hypothetical protein
MQAAQRVSVQRQIPYSVCVPGCVIPFTDVSSAINLSLLPSFLMATLASSTTIAALTVTASERVARRSRTGRVDGARKRRWPG